MLPMVAKTSKSAKRLSPLLYPLHSCKDICRKFRQNKTVSGPPPVVPVVTFGDTSPVTTMLITAVIPESPKW